MTITIATGAFFIIPPVLTGICNDLQIYDDRCPRISGIQSPFGGEIRIWNTIPPIPPGHPLNNIGVENDYFLDNITRTSVIHVSVNSSHANILDVSMTQSLVVSGDASYIPLWVFDATWNFSHRRDAMITSIENENHTNISLPSDVGTFQQVIKIPARSGNNKATYYYSLGGISIIHGEPNKVFVNYVLPHLLPINGTYVMNFTSPYPVQFDIASNIQTTYNYTVIYPASYAAPHPNLFSYDLKFQK